MRSRRFDRHASRILDDPMMVSTPGCVCGGAVMVLNAFFAYTIVLQRRSWQTRSNGRLAGVLFLIVSRRRCASASRRHSSGLRIAALRAWLLLTFLASARRLSKRTRDAVPAARWLIGARSCDVGVSPSFCCGAHPFAFLAAIFPVTARSWTLATPTSARIPRSCFLVVVSEADSSGPCTVTAPATCVLFPILRFAVDVLA